MKIILIIIFFFTSQNIKSHARDFIEITYQTGYNFKDNRVSFKIYKSIRGNDKIFKEVLEKMKKISELEHTSFVVPDASRIIIEINNTEEKYESSSCHTIFEKNPKLVATSHGITSLGDKTREQVLKEEPIDFLSFRTLWEETLNLCLGHINSKFK